jgi:hypothetical protein
MTGRQEGRELQHISPSQAVTLFFFLDILYLVHALQFQAIPKTPWERVEKNKK